ncbi:MAG: alpha-2-macroglobulin family protein [Archangium sp.]|nr:alpha-2-macroglobulin family protein [Archangium sp.]MDP3571179.1 alpha-2-macroglobulin family protein [Archangium sp.]
MKKFLILALTAVAILFITFLGLASPRAMSPSADALSGSDDRYYREEAAPSPVQVFAAPPPKMDEGVMGKMEKKRAAVGLGGLGLKGSGRGGGGSGNGYGSLGAVTTPMVQAGLMDAPAESEAMDGELAQPAATRAWFPETFLFEPLIVTDAQGRANIPVKVPDRLTTWRLLALAHSRQGSQAGSVASFLGTLPTYVEPVTPAFLYAGDSVRLPIQVVNTTDADITTSLAYEISGATLSGTGGVVKVPAGGNALQYVTLNTTKPGIASFKATLGNTDAIEKSIELKPAGRRELVSKAGTLAAPRTFSLSGPANPLPGTEAVRLRVYPGALGLIRNELSAAPGRGGVAEDAYLLQLLGQAPALLNSLGAKADEPVIRDLSILATQRVMQYARSPSVDTATLLTEAALAHPQNPVLARLGERLALQVAQQQRADGTCQGANGWTLQRLLVTTSDCVRAARASMETPAARQRATAVTLKASGAFERNAARVNDAYTAAAILASGAITGGVGDSLRKRVLEKLAESSDGGKYLPVDPGVVRADGVAPSTYEATAMAILALQDVKDAPLADLGTYLLSGYSSYSGWGDGRANLVALRAAVRLFKDPVPPGVKITLERDGQAITTGIIDAAALQSVLSLDADATGSGGAHTWTIRAEPAVPGLGYSLQLISYAPWKDEPGGGLELKTELPASLKVGLPADVKLTAAMPGGTPMQVELSLPAGVQADSTSLTKLVSSGSISRYETEDGLLTLHLPSQPNGALWQTNVKVIATLAGTLHSGASSLQPEANAAKKKEFAPVTWRVE